MLDFKNEIDSKIFSMDQVGLAMITVFKIDSNIAKELFYLKFF